MGEQAVCVEACMQQALEIKKAFEEQLSIQLTAAFTHPSSDEEIIVESQLWTKTNISDEEMIIFAAKLRDNNNTQKAAIATLPLTTHPQWAEPHTFN